MKSKLMFGIIIGITVSGLFVGCKANDITNESSQVSLSKANVENKTINEQVAIPKEGVKVDVVTNFGAQAAKEDKSLTTEEMLTYAIQDEYLAKKEYEVIMDKYGDQKPFNNIINAEEKHILQLTELINKYIKTVPEDKAKDYVVVPSSLNEAYKAGVTAEIENIDMYERFLKEDIPQDVKDIFVALRDASKSHLSAFEKNVR